MKVSFTKIRLIVLVGPLLLASCMQASLDPLGLPGTVESTSTMRAEIKKTELEVRTALIANPKSPTSEDIIAETATGGELDLPMVAPISRKRPTSFVNADQARSDMTGPGTLKPTIYYFVVIDEDNQSCEKNATIKGSGGVVLLNVCEKSLDACDLQGSCTIIQKGVRYTFNVIDKDRYFRIESDGCHFGYGVRSACLDPFYTLAADLKLYKPGEVIFVPKIVGTVLPDGSKHSGYFVIRDRGRGIRGIGRFDFFSGTMSWADSKNPFRKLGLGDVRTNLPYFRVGGKTAMQVLQNRSFPSLPSQGSDSP